MMIFIKLFLLVGDGGINHQLAVEQSDADAKRWASQTAGPSNKPPAEALVTAMTSGSFSLSAESTMETILGLIAPGFGRAGAWARQSAGSKDFLLRGRPSRLKKPREFFRAE